MLKRSLLVSLLAGACGIDTGTSPTLALGIEAQPDPFFTCAWRSPPSPNQNIAFTGYGYWGDERGFRIHHGNYVDPAGVNNNYLEYKIEVIWSMPGCAGTVYYVRFPEHGLVNHAEIEVRGGAQALKGKLVASKGSLPVLYNEASIPLPTHKLGPFVITPAMVGAGGMGDTIAFTLMDEQILTNLPYPVYYNGALPASLGQEVVMDTAHGDLIEANAYLHTFFTFRLGLETMTAADRQATSDSIDLVKEEPGPIHGDPLWEEHHHVEHNAAVEPAAAGVGFGAFWNGHRNLLREIEAHLRNEPTVPGFGRVPAWDPATTVPAEFEVGIIPSRMGSPFPGDLNGGTALEPTYRAANICANFDSALSALPTHAERMAEQEVLLWDDVKIWHNDLHGDVGGDLAPITTSASVPLFYPWHTTVDTIWNNWQLCEGAYHPNRYSWDEL